MSTRWLSPDAKSFQNAINNYADPVDLLFKKIPGACNCNFSDRERLITIVKKCKEEIMGVSQVYRNYAVDSIRQSLSLGANNGNPSVRGVAIEWSNCFSERFVQNITDGIARGLFERIRSNYETDDSLVDSLSSLLIGKVIIRWDDSSISLFDRTLKDTVRRIEEDALSAHQRLSDRDEKVNGIKHVLEARVASLMERLVNLVGADEAKSFISTIMQERIDRK